MLPATTDDDRRSFRTMLRKPLRGVVREASKLDDPADLEEYGATLLPAAALLTIPGAAREAVAAIADVPGALTVLRGIAAAAPPPLSSLAAEAAAALGPGPVSVAAEQVGTLVPERAWRLDLGEPVSSVQVECRRRGAARSQVLCFTLEWPLTDGAIKDGFASAPVETSQVDELFLGPVLANGIEPEKISPDEAIDLVARGAARCAEARLGPSPEALVAATLLLRAAGRADADELLEPLVGLPSLAEAIDEFPADEHDEEQLQGEVDELCDALEEWVEGQGLDRELGELTAYAGRCMADFRAFFCDGRLAAWSPDDLEGFLFDFVPRKVGFEGDEIERFPGAVAEVLRFLGESGRLDPSRADHLGALALAARADFVVEARDPSSWGPAKGMAAAMSAAGVDVTDEDAVQAWIDTFNGQTPEGRERLVPALRNLPLPPPPPQSSGQGKRKATRAKKAQRQARRRNRRS